MSSYEVDVVKIEKEKAMRRYRLFNKIVKIARTLEFFFAAMFFSWLISRSSSYFSAISQLFSVFLHRFSMLLLNHHFVFLLGNGIIVTLFVKFGQFDCKKQSIAADCECEEYLIGQVAPPHETTSCEIPPQESVSGEKHIIPSGIEAAPVTSPVAGREPEVKRCRRSRSHEFDRERTEKIQLQRSETEPRRKLEKSDKEQAFDVDNLSNEEFQRKVEAFIARQQKFLREESLSIVYA